MKRWTVGNVLLPRRLGGSKWPSHTVPLLLFAACAAPPSTGSPAEDAAPPPLDSGSLDASPRDAIADGPLETADAGPINDGAGSDGPLTAFTVRLARPHVVRGPANDEMDQPLSELLLGAGGFRAFSANATTYGVDGPDVFSIGGARTAVLTPGPTGSFSECGEWLNGIHDVAGTLYGFIHCESACDYNVGQTHKSMAVATSSDEGLHWSAISSFITGTDEPTPDTTTGEGDCTVTDGHDGYLYAYCLRDRDWRTIVARAPRDAPVAGQWLKWDGSGWSAPALGGDAASLGPIGQSAGYWSSRDAIFLVEPDTGFGGLHLFLSTDRTTFTTYEEPLVPLDGNDWNRPATTELYAYPSFLSETDGSNGVGDAFVLAHLYIAPNEGFGSRYYVLRQVIVTELASEPEGPRVGVELTRWYSSADHDRWTTTAPVPGNDTTYLEDRSLGYLLTQPR